LQRLLALADRERLRFTIVLVLAGVLCLALLARSVAWLGSREPLPHLPATIEMRLVELAPPAATVAPAMSAPSAMRTPTAPVMGAAKHTQTAPPTHSVPSRTLVQPPQSQPPRPHQPQPREEAHSPAKPTTREQPAAPSTPAPATIAQSASNTAAATPSNGSATTAPPAPSGNLQVRLLSQPMPVLPDDLREQGYQVTAVAHFKVHTDGTFEVELIKPTQNPRLNQILLETLHRWRFFPAMENGHPVESDQEVRVHFSVS
jgi:protein TonB